MKSSTNSFAVMAAVAFFATAAEAQTPESGGPVLSHPVPAESWQASYRYDCGGSSFGISLSMGRGSIPTVTALDLGRAGTPENIERLNAAFSSLTNFRELFVLCGPGGGANLQFLGTSKGSEGRRPGSVTIKWAGPRSDTITIENASNATAE